MSFSISKPVTKVYIGGGNESSTINNYVDISGVVIDISANINVDISSNINVDISGVVIDVSGVFYTDICQYNSLYWQNVNKTIGKVSIADSNNLDAFGRFRVSNPSTLFDGKMIDSSQNIIFDSSWNNGGRLTYLPLESSMQMDISLANSFVKRQSHYFSQYQPGKSLAVLASFYFGTVIPAGAYRRVGWFDDKEGIFFEQTSTGFRWRIESQSAPSISVNQSNWNIDKLDGTGPSALTLSMANTNLMILDVEWLGVGRVRVGFVLNGMITYCHQFTQALTSVYIRSPSLPVRYMIGTTSAQSFDVSMKQICCTVLSEGGYEPLGILASYIMESSNSGIGTSFIPILSARLRTPYQKGELKPVYIDIEGDTGTTFLYKILRNTTLSGPTSWTNVNDYSQIDIGSNGLSGGQTIVTGFIINNSRLPITEIPNTSMIFQSNIDGVSDIFTIAIRAKTGNNKSASASLTWQEIV
jgi:hypothetical protein